MCVCAHPWPFLRSRLEAPLQTARALTCPHPAPPPAACAESQGELAHPISRKGEGKGQDGGAARAPGDPDKLPPNLHPDKRALGRPQDVCCLFGANYWRHNSACSPPASQQTLFGDILILTVPAEQLTSEASPLLTPSFLTASSPAHHGSGGQRNRRLGLSSCPPPISTQACSDQCPGLTAWTLLAHCVRAGLGSLASRHPTDLKAEAWPYSSLV